MELQMIRCDQYERLQRVLPKNCKYGGSVSIAGDPDTLETIAYKDKGGHTKQGLQRPSPLRLC